MLRILIFCTIILSAVFTGHAIIPYTTAQEEYFYDGDFGFNYCSGLAFIDNIDDLSKYHEEFKDYDQETLQTVKQHIGSSDKAIIGYYYILTKSAYGFFYTLANDPTLQAVRDAFGPDHHMTLLAEAICSPNLSKRPAMFDSAIDAINDELGEDSWEYAYAHILKATALVFLENYEDAKYCAEKAIELNNLYNRADWWAQLHAQVIRAAVCTNIKEYGDIDLILWGIVHSASSFQKNKLKQIGLMPFTWLSKIYLLCKESDRAIDLDEKLLLWYDGCGLKDSEGAAIVKHNYASALYEAGRYREAYNLMLEAQDSYKRLGMENTQPASYLKKWIKLAKSKL